MDFYEDYNDYLDEFDEHDYTYPEDEDNYELLNDCIYPTLTDGFKHFLTPILVANLFLRFATLVIRNVWLNGVLTIATGLSLLYYHLSDDKRLLVAIVLYLLIGSITCLLGPKQSSLVWITCIGFVCLNESLVLLDQSFIRLRSHIMLLIMKMIAFNALINEETDKEHFQADNILVSSLIYLLHPLSLLLGVWHPFRLNRTNNSIFVSLIKCLYNLLVSIVFLLLSTCLIHHFVGQKLIGYIVFLLSSFMPNSLVYFLEICLTVYITAQQFRFSHYFICFATQSMLCLWNSDLRVTDPMSIEFSRSLVDVVVAWNIPMHIWLKTHVFNPSKRKFGAFQAIFITYFISSFLHGFNFQIWSVLLSLGVLTKLEYELREELSKIFNSCIHVRRCHHQSIESNESNKSLSRWKFWNRDNRSKVCVSKRKHTNTPYNCKWVPVVNLLFSVLAISHLSYLGSTFDGKEESSKVVNVLSIWKELKFYSHIMSVLTFIFYKMI